MASGAQTASGFDMFGLGADENANIEKPLLISIKIKKINEIKEMKKFPNDGLFTSFVSM